MINLRITTHSGEDDVIEVENYNPDELVEKLNDNEIYSIKIGSNIYSRIDIKNIKQV